MPQLMPDPWFYVFIMVWLVIIILPKKILNHKILNYPSDKKNISLTNGPSKEWTYDWS